jgi:hypothetical protein
MKGRVGQLSDCGGDVVGRDLDRGRDDAVQWRIGRKPVEDWIKGEREPAVRPINPSSSPSSIIYRLPCPCLTNVFSEVAILRPRFRLWTCVVLSTSDTSFRRPPRNTQATIRSRCHASSMLTITDSAFRLLTSPLTRIFTTWRGRSQNRLDTSPWMMNCGSTV